VLYHDHHLAPLFDHLTLKPEQWLFHYTGIDTLLSMLKSDTPSLWLSGISYLNDSKELMHGHDLMLKRLNDLGCIKDHNSAAQPLLRIFADTLGLKQNTTAHMYVMSFSEAANSLNQWRSYTPHGKGISMTFDFKQENDFFEKCGLMLVKCLYEEQEQVNLIDALINYVESMFSDLFEEHTWPQTISELPTNEKFHSTYASALATGYLIFSIIKHPAFKDEKEWRLIAQKTNDLTEIDFRSGSNMLLPYLVAPIDLPHYFKSIMIGPTAHKELAGEAISGLLKKYKLEQLGYSTSNIPYREW
jgi:hypothetical protein